jgi:hypothetical protein
MSIPASLCLPRCIHRDSPARGPTQNHCRPPAGLWQRLTMDSRIEPWYSTPMKASTKGACWLPVLFVLFAYTATPLLHNAICIDCLCPAQFSFEDGNGCNELTHFNPTGSTDAGDAHDTSPAGARGFCSVCAHASGVPQVQQEQPSFTGVFFEIPALTPVPSSIHTQVYRPPEIA